MDGDRAEAPRGPGQAVDVVAGSPERALRCGADDVDDKTRHNSCSGSSLGHSDVMRDTALIADDPGSGAPATTPTPTISSSNSSSSSVALDSTIPFWNVLPLSEEDMTTTHNFLTALQDPRARLLPEPGADDLAPSQIKLRERITALAAYLRKYGDAAFRLVDTTRITAETLRNHASSLSTGRGGVIGFITGSNTGINPTIKATMLDAATSLTAAHTRADGTYQALAAEEVNVLHGIQQAWGNDIDLLIKAEEDLNTAKNEIEQLQARFVDTHSELLDRYAEIETLKSANNVLSEKQAVHRDTVHRLALAEQQKVELEDKVEELGRQLATAQDAKDTAENNLTKLQERLGEALTERDAARKECKEDKEAYEKAIEIITRDANTAVTAANTALNSTKALLTAARKSRDKNLADFHDEQRKVKGLEGRIEELKKEMTETDTKHTAALERKASELTEARGALAEVKKHLATLQGAHKTLQERKEALQALLDTIDNKPKVELQREVDSLKKELQTLTSAKEDMERQLEAQQKEVLLARRDQALAERHAEKLSAQVEGLKGDGTSMDHRIVNLVQDNSNLLQMLTASQTAATEAQSRAASLSEQLRNKNMEESAKLQSLRDSHQQQYQAQMDAMYAQYCQAMQAALEDKERKHVSVVQQMQAALETKDAMLAAANQARHAAEQEAAAAQAKASRMRAAAEHLEADEAVCNILLLWP